jgi:hypothetical protein
MKKQSYPSQTEVFHITKKMGLALAIFAALLTWYILPEYGSALASPVAAPEMSAPAIAPAALQENTTPQPVISAVNVAPGGFVELLMLNLPDNDEFRVTMGPSGSMGIGGGLVAHFNTNDAGTYEMSFEIYAPLRNDSYIDVRIDDGDGVAAWTRFHNAAAVTTSTTTTTSGTGGSTTTSTTTTTTTATTTTSGGSMQVIHVVRSGYVVVTLSNIVNDQNFSVRMGSAETLVAHVSNGDATTITATFEMAAPVRDSDSFTLHIQSDKYNFVQTVSNFTY